MKKSRFFKLIIFALVIGMPVLSASCSASSKKTDINGNNEAPFVKMAAKSNSILLFQIDSGTPVELTSVYKGKKSAYNKALNNIYEGLKPFTQGYNVAVLIEPQQGYKKEGFGGKASDPLNRVSPELIHALDFFKSKGDIKVYFELMSSDIYTNQNGELSSLTPPPLHFKDTNTVKGLSMDIDTLAAIKKAYPNTFSGVRFHELIGTDQLGMNNDPHAFIVDFNAVGEIIDTCAENDIKLIWSDHGWNEKGTVPGRLELWEGLMNKASEKLNENVTFNWANNTYGVNGALGNTPGKQNIKNIGRTKWGLSCQTWFWPTLVSTTWKSAQNVQQFYPFIENGMPVELMASFTLTALSQGASVIQFEPPWYFFNYNQAAWLIQQQKKDPFFDISKGYAGNYEQAPDYGAKLALKRFSSMLLYPNNKSNPSNNIMDYFGGEVDSLKMSQSFSNDPPEKYNQTTLNLYTTDGHRRHFDFYNNNQYWVEQNKYRFGEWIFEGKVLAASRIKLWAEPQDNIMIVKDKNGKRVVEFYNQRSCFMGSDNVIAADNADGKFVAITTANMVSEFIDSVKADPDEIIVLRKKDGQENLSVSIYKISNGLKADYIEFTCTEITGEQKTDLMNEFIGKEPINAETFVGMNGLRHDNRIYGNQTRGYDGIALLTRIQNNLTLKVRSFGKNSVLNIDFKSYDKFLFTTADTNCDYKDELCIMKLSGEKGVISTYHFNNNKLTAAYDVKIEMGKRKADLFYSLKTSAYNNSPTNLKYPDTLKQGINLALNANASLNTSIGYGNIPKKAVDGDYSTWVSSGENGAKPDLTIDLGTAKDINRIVVVCPNSNYPKGFILSTSQDGENWTKVATETSVVSEVKYIYDFETTKARYVLLRTTELTGIVFNLSEIEVYNTTK